MFTISQFSKICQVSIKALRYYEKIGLLTPARVEPGNQYRYYTSEQVNLVKQVSYFKDLGIPLKTIKQIIIDQAMESGKIEQLLVDHRKYLMQQIDLYNNQLIKLGWWKKEMEVKNMSGNNLYDVCIRDMQSMAVRARRGKLTSFPATLPTLIQSVLEEITAAGAVAAGAPIVLYYDEEFNPAEVDVEVAWPVTDETLANQVLPVIRAACCMHVGPYDELNNAYETIFTWINRNGYRALSPIREISCNDPRTTPPEKLVTEVLVPIAMAK